MLPLAQEEADGDGQGQGLGGHDGQPDAVHLQDQGQQQHGGHLEQQGAQEGDAGGHRAVAQGGEEGGTENVEAHQQEGQGVKPQAAAGEGKQLRVIAHEQTAQGGGQPRRDEGEGAAGDGDQGQALAEQVVQLVPVGGPEVEADDRGAAHGVAQEDGHENKVHVHNDPIGGHAVLPRQAHELEVIEHVHQGHGQVGHQLRRAVGAGLEQGPAVEPGGT